MNKPILAASMGVAFGLFLGGLFFAGHRHHSCPRHAMAISQAESVVVRPLAPHRPCTYWQHAESGAAPAAPLQLQDATTLLTRAQHAYVDGDYKTALSLARLAQEDQPTRAWRIIGASACNVQDRNLASESFQHLDSAGRQYLAYVCHRNDIELGNKPAR